MGATTLLREIRANQTQTVLAVAIVKLNIKLCIDLIRLHYLNLINDAF